MQKNNSRNRRNKKRRSVRNLDRNLKNIKINGDVRKKLVGLFVIVVLALVGLSIRITYINAKDGDRYTRQVLSQSQQKYTSRTIPFRRGDILDRNGTILATSEKVYNVILDCKVVNTVVKKNDKETQPYVEPTVEALVNILGLSEEDIRSRLESEETKESQYQILVKELSIDQKKAFEEYVNAASDENSGLSDEERAIRSNVKGVWFEDAYHRTYPLGSLACDTIGFTYSGNQADWGLEAYYSSVLNGVDGRQYGYYNTDADVEQTIIEAEDGNSIRTTLDANVQQILRKYLQEFNEKIGNGGNGAKNAAVMVMNPNTGEILGIDSTDWYDLNNPTDLTPFYSQSEIDAMDDQTTVENLSAIWTNFAVSQAFEPGSTIKPMTVAAALESGAISADDTFTCTGSLQVGDRTIGCTGSHGTQTLAEAIKHSCNVAMMEIGEKMGVEDMIKYESIFSFGSRTGIDLPNENSGAIFSTDSMGVVDLAVSAFGQGLTVNMVQEAAAFCSVINGGNYYQPHLVSEIIGSDGSVVERIEPTLFKKTVSQEVSDLVRGYCAEPLKEGGTATQVKISGYSMGGKTGTAEKYPRGNGKYLLSFIGFAPLDDPQVVVYVVVDEPNQENQEDGSNMKEIARGVFSELLPYLNIFPDEDENGNPLPDQEESTVAEGVTGDLPDPLESPNSTDDNDMTTYGLTNDESEYTN